MSNYPKLNELLEAVIKDCNNYLDSNSDPETKKSFPNILKKVENLPEIAQTAYLIFCSCKSNIPSSIANSEIAHFTQDYIEDIHIYFKKNNKTDEMSTINDCCNSYIALFGFAFIQEGVFQNEYRFFPLKFFTNFIELLDKYHILKEVQNYYIENLTYIDHKVNNNDNSQHFGEFIKCFEKENVSYKFNESHDINSTTISDNKNNNDSNESSNIENHNGKIDGSENKKDSVKAIEIRELKVENKNQQTEEPNSKNKSLEDQIALLTKELSKVKIKLEFSDIERCFSELEIFQQLILNTEFNSSIINIENKRSEYLENVINSLKKIITNLSNPYNYNLWRKLSNIILKNIFVILHNKKCTFIQNYSKSVLNQLYKYADKLPDIEKESYLNKIKT